jgi:hypothetical protein
MFAYSNTIERGEDRGEALSLRGGRMEARLHAFPINVNPGSNGKWRASPLSFLSFPYPSLSRSVFSLLSRQRKMENKF